MRLKLLADPTRVPRFVLLAGFFLCPVVFDPNSVKPFDISKVSVLWFFSWLAVGAWLVEVALGRIRAVRFRVGLVAAAFIGAVGLATIFSSTPIVSFFGWYGRYNGFLEELLFVADGMLVVQLYWRVPERLKEVWIALGAASVIVAVYLLVQWRGLDPFTWARIGGGHLFQFASTMGNSNFAGGYLGATFAWLLFAWWRARRWWTRGAVLVWALITIFAIWLSASRGGLLAAVGTVAVGLLAISGRFSRRVVGALFVVATVLVVSAVFVGSRPAVRVSGARTPTAPQAVLRSGTLRTRAWWWAAAARNFIHHPIVGTGPDTFVIVWPRNAPRESAGFADAETADKPHNVILEHASSLGTLGLGAYLLVVTTCFLFASDRLKILERRERAMLASFTAFLAGYLGQALFSIDVTAIAMVGWVSVGGIAALADPRLVAARDREPTEEPAPRGIGPPRLVAGVAIALIAVLVAGEGVRPWLADRAAKIPSRLASTGSAGEIRRRYERAIALAPWEPLYRGLAGDFLAKRAAKAVDNDEKVALLTDAVTLLKQMEPMQPGHPLWKMATGEGLGLLGQTGDLGSFYEADQDFSDARSLAPYDWRIASRYGEMLNRWARTTKDASKHCEALKQFKESVALRKNDVRAWIGLATTYAYLGRLDEADAAVKRGERVGKKAAAAVERELRKLRTKKLKRISCG